LGEGFVLYHYHLFLIALFWNDSWSQNVLISILMYSKINRLTLNASRSFVKYFAHTIWKFLRECALLSSPENSAVVASDQSPSMNLLPR
jgi:hypothetical protein